MLTAPPIVAAQLPVEAWVRPLLALPVGEFADRGAGVDAGPSVGYDVGASFRAGPLALYGEYHDVSFRCGECAEVDLHDRVRDRGWGAGVIVPLPRPHAGLRPWARLGVIGHRLRLRHGEETAHSNAGLGWSAGAGVDARPLPWLRVEPALIVRSYGTRFGFAIDVPDRDLSVTWLGLGLALGFAL